MSDKIIESPVRRYYYPEYVPRYYYPDYPYYRSVYYDRYYDYPRYYYPDYPRSYYYDYPRYADRYYYPYDPYYRPSELVTYRYDPVAHRYWDPVLLRYVYV